MNDSIEYTGQQRAALVTVRLLRGERLTNQQIAEVCGYADTSSAWRLMMQLAALHSDMALTYTGGNWFVVDTQT